VAGSPESWRRPSRAPCPRARRARLAGWERPFLLLLLAPPLTLQLLLPSSRSSLRLVPAAIGVDFASLLQSKGRRCGPDVGVGRLVILAPCTCAELNSIVGSTPKCGVVNYGRLGRRPDDDEDDDRLSRAFRLQTGEMDGQQKSSEAWRYTGACGNNAFGVQRVHGAHDGWNRLPSSTYEVSDLASHLIRA